MFVKSLRSADFVLFWSCIKEILPWMFALDHTHYSRWMAVFLHDFNRLQEKKQRHVSEFFGGHFVVNESGKVFSSMAEDQAHEQNNKHIKGDGRAIGIFDNENALMKWAISGPVLAKPLDQGNSKLNKKHLEDTDLYEKTFHEEGLWYLQCFKILSNPFRETENCLVNVDSK